LFCIFYFISVNGYFISSNENVVNNNNPGTYVTFWLYTSALRVSSCFTCFEHDFFVVVQTELFISVCVCFSLFPQRKRERGRENKTSRKLSRTSMFKRTRASPLDSSHRCDSGHVCKCHWRTYFSHSTAADHSPDLVQKLVLMWNLTCQGLFWRYTL